ncbi:hypothetical protein EMIHUDRAFT_200827 [Emiliania huxleyi CCMP1516]|uniref:Uncharacterized protein n=2 Tax=Emiliania huxleyi TaxID=2903 RepID=A0A0D3KR78_EMIH1|nr:hypothetical protein EMIHUDRAFT_200827 [Emiliania huxleyi CCMP1516]EOD38263.1 hypothetical protein EMIHUDRAFT_200827 [Emiliania huxleyi CCMP1516]|eukprot:XP_005790692.1 hypothetical protein EMIHUDRAFT_200827 [Emiliania huxleyi CCMP1516]
MAASSDLQALQLQIRNLEQKIDFQHREIKKRDMHMSGRTLLGPPRRVAAMAGSDVVEAMRLALKPFNIDFQHLADDWNATVLTYSCWYRDASTP